MPQSAAQPNAKTRLLEAALSVIRTKGYSATSVDKLCAAAGVTKGAFTLAKATDGPEVAADSLDHLRRFVEMLFGFGVGPANHPTDGSLT